MNREPSPNGSNGRRPDGRFAKGWKGGPGNPHAKRVAELRRVLLGAVTDDDLGKVVKKLVAKAKAGESWAVKELLDRLLGKAPQALELTGAEGEPLAGLTLPALFTGLLERLRPYPEARADLAKWLCELEADADAERPGAGS